MVSRNENKTGKESHNSPNTDAETKEVKIRFGNLNYRSIIGALLYVSCCTRPDITYAVNKLAKFSNNPGTTHFRALLHFFQAEDGIRD